MRHPDTPTHSDTADTLSTITFSIFLLCLFFRSSHFYILPIERDKCFSSCKTNGAGRRDERALVFFLPSPVIRAFLPLRLLSPVAERTPSHASRWRLILAVDYQFSTNLVPLVAASAFVPLITPWLLLSPPAGYGRSALHIMPRYISSIVRDLPALSPYLALFSPFSRTFSRGFFRTAAWDEYSGSKLYLCQGCFTGIEKKLCF